MEISLICVALLAVINFVRVDSLVKRIRTMQQSLDDVADSASDHVRG